jgi:hypothetical protein
VRLDLHKVCGSTDGFRFSLKFRKIVENERDSNFITRLHDGKLKIISWPVIESEGFYKLFKTVKKALDRQPTSHHTAGEFLLTLKTLMAKLKVRLKYLLAGADH